MTTQQGAKGEQQQFFQECHLQILRSLYNDAGSSEKSLDSKTGDNEQDNIDENVADDDSEAPVSSETWDLIDRFLKQRNDYLPQLQRQMHWNEIYAEASSRRDHFISTHSKQQQQASLPRAPSLTTRNLAFSAVKRRSLSTPNSHINLSLTPLTNNRNDNSHELSEVSIPSWNFISRIVKKRQDACTKSCDSFRSEPFLLSLLVEAEARCKVLKVALEELKKNEIAADFDHVGDKRGSTALSSPFTKRVKFHTSADECAAGISFFKQTASSPEQIDPDERNKIKYSNAIIQNQIKLNLWSSLTQSVQKVIAVGKK